MLKYNFKIIPRKKLNSNNFKNISNCIIKKVKKDLALDVITICYLGKFYQLNI